MTIGSYEILDEIGRDSLGQVYRARDMRVGRTVRLKVIADDIAGDPARREALVADARVAAALSHPNIAALFEIGEQPEGALFLSQELAPGQRLAASIASGPLNPRRAIDYAAQVADGLAEGHALGVTHGALSAESVVVTPKGNVKILDFGLSRWIEPSLGTERSVPTEEDDIRALGLLLAEMLSGRRVADGAFSAVIGRVGRGVPAELGPIVTKLVADHPEERHQSAATVAAELRAVAAILDTRGEWQTGGAPPSQPTSRSRVGWIVALLVLAAVAALVWAAIAWQ